MEEGGACRRAEGEACGEGDPERGCKGAALWFRQPIEPICHRTQQLLQSGES
jgi:hypothetical protein